MYTFDGDNKLIILDFGVTTFSATDVYSRWKQWMLIGDNSKYLPAFANSVGGDPLGSGTTLGAYIFLQNGWVVRPHEADHTLIATGNLFPIPDTASVFTPTLGDFTVQIVQQVSSLTQSVLVNTGGGGSTLTAEDVWNYDITNTNVTGSAGKQLKEVKQLAKNAFAASV